jgi:predicted DNA-binding transcriptional regulator
MLHYIFNNIIANVEKNLLYLGLKGKKINIFSIVIKDKNIYSELKTNLGLFNVKNFFNINLFFLGCKSKYNLLLLKNLKYI